MNITRGWLIGFAVMVGLWTAFALAIRFLIPGPPDLPPDAFELPPPWLLLMLLCAALYTAVYAIAVVIRLGAMILDRFARWRTLKPH